MEKKGGGKGGGMERRGEAREKVGEENEEEKAPRREGAGSPERREEKERRAWRTVRLLGTEMIPALCRTGRTLPPGARGDLGKSFGPELLPHGTPGVPGRRPPLPHPFLVAASRNAPGLRRPFQCPG